jgi:hypothetical protein
MLLLRSPEYWARALPVTASTHLWSACHDGTSTRLTSLNVPTLSEHHDGIDRSSTGDGAGDGAGQPWYLSPLTSNTTKLQALQHYAGTALLREGLDCLKAQLQVLEGQHRHDLADSRSGGVSGSRKRWFSTSHPEPPETHQAHHSAPLPPPPQQQAQRGGSGLLTLLQKAFNTAVLLLVVFAAGRFWPQLSELLATNPTPVGNGGASSNSAARASREANLHGTPPHHPHTAPNAHHLPPLAPTSGYPAAAAGGHFMMREGPDQLTITSPTSAPPSLPSAPTTPARATAVQEPPQGPGSIMGHGPGGLGLSLKPGPSAAGLNPGLAPVDLDGLRSLSTAASLDQLQMDNVQLAELVSQLHSEVGGSRAAAADASAAVRRQQVGGAGAGAVDTGDMSAGAVCGSGQGHSSTPRPGGVGLEGLCFTLLYHAVLSFILHRQVPVTLATLLQV